VTRFLLATDSVHTTAAACDYLAGRLDEGDAVIVLAVAEPGAPSRDGADALNVATVRLDLLASVETASAEGAPAETILSVAAERDVDEVVVGGAPGTGTDLGSTARAVVAQADRAVVVVPVPRLD
jgi:nucleotide-binding universal stress UspA family protein